jgi:hypothetical protein
MSIAEFSEALRSPALKAWFQRLSTDNILKMSAKDIRKKEAGRDFNSFYISEKTVSDIIEKLSGANASPEMVTRVFKKLANTRYDNNRRLGKALAEPYVEGSALYFPRISFDGIASLLDTGFDEVLQEARKKTPDLKISDYFQRGHVFGIFPKKLAMARKSLEKNTTLTDQARSLLVEYLSGLEQQLETEDLATSNLKTPAYSLYAKYRKKANSYLVEMQLKEVNEAAGRSQASLATAVRKYLNPDKVTFTSKGIKFTEGAAEQKLRALMEQTVEKLIGTKGSPSMLDLIGMSVSEAISGKKNPNNKEYVVNTTKIAAAKASKIDTRELRAGIKKDLAKVKKLKASVKAVPKFVPAEVDTANLVSLQSILDAQLVQRVKDNMGDGTRRDILNLRSGRLAESVKVERLSESRAGMITAFYSYMKNPYATFSQGGRQQSPRSRDPKALISKSIREIAATQVGNRLRAVLV